MQKEREMEDSWNFTLIGDGNPVMVLFMATAVFFSKLKKMLGLKKICYESSLSRN